MIDPKTLKVGDMYLAGKIYGTSKESRTRIVKGIEDWCVELVGKGKMAFCDYEYWLNCEPLPKPVQNPSPYRFDLLPADAMLKIAELMATGDAEHGRDNWKKVMASEHEGRSIGHMYESMSAKPEVRKREDHYTHAALRAIFALQMAIEEGKV